MSIAFVLVCPTHHSSGPAQKAAQAAQFDHKGFPKIASADPVFSSSLFPGHVSVLLRVSDKKMADCDTTTGHVGHFARTLMTDARRGLNR